MKTVVRIAKTELRTLFYSPIAWFLMIVFLVQCGITYFGQLNNQAQTQEIGGIGLQYMTHLTERVFTSQMGLFPSVMQKLYLFIPLLTMGLISRETSSGTVKLLYSSPIKVREIVFGKYLAMMIYSLLLVAIVGIFMVDATFHIKNADGGLLLSGAIGFYLLLCAYSAIGLFMSCLTTYQVVAAVCTFVMIGILSYIGTLWQDIDFIRDLTYFLSLNGRAEKILVGLITTKDVLYFVIIVYIFLGLSIYKLRAGMESKPPLVKAGRYVALVASALLIGYISSFPSLTGYLDLTTNKSRTLAPNAQKIIRDFGEAPLEVTVYNNLLCKFNFLGLPASRNQNLSRWEPYIRFKNDIRLNFVQYYDSALDASYMSKLYRGKTTKQIAEQMTKSMGLKMSMLKTPEEIRKNVDLRPELNRFVMQLKYKNRTTFLRVFDDQMMWPSETEVSAAFKRLQQAKLPKIAFLTGNLERSIDKIGDKDYKILTNQSTFRYSLVNQGFDVDTITLDSRDIPADIVAIVVADPRVALSPATMARLTQWIDKGGNLLIAGEPGRQSLLNPLLQQLGVQLAEGQVVQQSQQFSPDLITTDVTNIAGGFTKSLAYSKADSQKVSLPGAAGVSYNTNGPFAAQPLLLSDSKLSWSRKQKLDLDMVTDADASDKGTPTVMPHNTPMRGAVTRPAGSAMVAPLAMAGVNGMAVMPGSTPREQKPAAMGTVNFSVENGDVRGPVTMAVSLSRKINGKEQRIVVTGDADFMSNAELNRSNMNTANFVFNTALFSWLNYGDFPIDTSRPDAKDKRVTVSTDAVDGLKMLYIWILPGILVAFAAILLIRRKRK